MTTKPRFHDPRLRQAYVVHIEERDVASLLDMLRYEAATVLKWEHEGKGWRITLASERFTPDRWASFLIRPEQVS